MEHLQQHIEALIFAAEQPILLTEIQQCLDAAFETQFAAEVIRDNLEKIKNKFADQTFAFELTEIADGYQFLTKPAYHAPVSAYLRQTTKRRLSQAAIETLAIIAYRQPVSKTELEHIRGVSCDYTLQKLLEKELVLISGRSEGPGRPLLYATSPKFMHYFGLKNLADLPKPKEFAILENAIGEEKSIEEAVNSAPNTSLLDQP